MPGTKKKTLLLIEDDEFMRQSVPDYLAAEGFRVILAENAADALAAAGKHHPEVAVVDLVIPPDAASERSIPVGRRRFAGKPCAVLGARSNLRSIPSEASGRGVAERQSPTCSLRDHGM